MATSVQQDRQAAEAIDVVRAFVEAINRRDIDAVMALVTDDIVWETTSPPDGDRIEGHAAVRTAGAQMLAGSTESRFEEEEIFAVGDRVVQRWVYHWVDHEGKAGHVRGVDVNRVRDGKVCESLAYVKG